MLIMHGGMGFDHTFLRPWLDPLSDGTELIYFDFRGHGRSGDPGNWDQVDHQTWIDDAEAVLRISGHEKIILFGHSYGGYIAQDFALAHPDRLSGLILCNTAPALDYVEVVLNNAKARGTAEQVELLMDGLSSPITDDLRFEEIIRGIQPLYVHDLRLAQRLSESFREVRFCANAFNRGNFHCLPRFETTGRLHEIRVPTLILGGRHDWITPPAYGAERLHAGIPNSELVIFENSNHFCFLEEPERFQSVMRAWIAAREPDAMLPV